MNYIQSDPPANACLPLAIQALTLLTGTSCMRPEDAKAHRRERGFQNDQAGGS